jgi:hypothetical protein
MTYPYPTNSGAQHEPYGYDESLPSGVWGTVVEVGLAGWTRTGGPVGEGGF